METKQKYSDIDVIAEPIGWLILGWSNEKQEEVKLTADMPEIIQWMADYYFDGSLYEAELAFALMDEYQWKDEIINFAKDKWNKQCG